MNKNYFEIFKLEILYEIDLAQLKAKYLELQQLYHPDKDKTVGSVVNILDINQAYKILTSPIERAIYLLKLKHIYIGEEDDSIKPSTELLEEIFELREQIYDLNDLSSLSRIQKNLEKEINSSSQLFAENYPKNLEEAAQEALRMQYYYKTIEDLKILKNKLLEN